MNHNNNSCFTCLNHNCLIKKHSEKATLAPFLEQKHLITCKKSQQFILEGTPVYGLYFIKEGIVKVSQNNPNGRDHIIRISAKGEIVGHRGFGTGNIYQINAIALAHSSLCVFPADVINQMLHAEPELMFDFMIFYADQLQKSETNAKRLTQMTVRDKVICTLLFLDRKFGQSNDVFNLTLKRKDIADFAGTTEEQVIKVLSKLKSEELIHTKGREIGSHKVQELKNEIPPEKTLLDS